MKYSDFPKMKLLAALMLLCGAWTSCASDSKAQGTDSVFLKSGGGRSSVVRGRVTGTTPRSVTVQSDGKSEDIAPGNIRRIAFAGEPNQLSRARDRMEAGRYDDCLAELGKIKDAPDSPLIQTEIAFIQANCTALKSLRGGTVTAQEAGREVNDFLKQYSSSHHVYPATELKGHLLLAIGKPDLAEAEFAKLTQSGWPEYVARGQFYRGEACLRLGNLAEAQQSFEALRGTKATDDQSQQYKLIAECQLAKVLALTNQVEAGKKLVEKIIEEESSDNSLLFAYAYNALGTCHLQAGEYKPAAIAFLHTELLFAAEPEPHAEALYQLTQIWPQLEDTDRANRARQALKSRYRNSYWASKL